MIISPYHQSYEIKDIPNNFLNESKFKKVDEKYLPRHFRPHTSNVSSPRKLECTCHVQVPSLNVSQEKKSSPQNNVKRPNSARNKMNFAYKTDLPKSSSKIPNADEIKKMEKEIRASRPKSILWGESSHSINNSITKEITSETPPKQSKVINDLHEKLDMNTSLAPSKLISTTAFVQDYIGLTNSLAFIR